MTKLLRLLFNSTLNSVIFGILLLLCVAAYVALGSGMPALREQFEMNEIQFFNAWPLKVLMLLLVATLGTVTWVRIPLTPPRYGVWCIHLGIITLIISTAFHYRHKIEGVTIVPVSATVDHFYDVTERSLYVRVPGRPMGWKPVPQLPRFKTYADEKGNAAYLDRPGLKNLDAVNALDPFTGQLETRPLAELLGSPSPVKLDIVGYHPYADVVTTYDEDASSDQTGVRLDLHSEADHADTTRYLIFADPDARQADVGGITLEHRHLKNSAELEEARKASVEGLAKLHRLDVTLGSFQQTLNVQIGSTYAIGSTGYSIAIESFDPAFPAMNGEIVQLLTMMVKSPTQTFRRQVISKRETPTDWKLGVAGAGPLGKRQTEPLDAELKTFYLYKDEAGFMPTTSRERYTFVTAGDGDSSKILLILASADRASQVRDLSPGESIELKTDPVPTLLNVVRVGHVRRRDQIVDVPREKRVSDEGQSGRRQVLAVKISSGEWSQTVPVPAAQWPMEMVGAWGGPVIQVPGAGKPMRLQLGNTLMRLPARVTLDKFELVTFPGGEPGKSGMFRDFKSFLTVQDMASGEKIQDVAHLNSPVYVNQGRWPFRQSWLLFQAQWDPDAQRWSVLGVGSRPGVGVMVLGCVMIGSGLLYAFYAKPYVIRRMKRKALAEHQAKQNKKSHAKARSREEVEEQMVNAGDIQP